MAFELRDSTGYSFLISGDVVRVGRSKDNTVVLNDAAVSRYHLNFYVKNNELLVEDAGSQNGYSVNGQMTKGSARLAPGDKVGIGSKEYLVQVAGSAGLAMEAGFNGTQNRARPLGQMGAAGTSTRQAFVNPTYQSNSGASNGRVKLYGGLALLIAIGALVLRKQEIDPKRNPASTMQPKPGPTAPLTTDRVEKYRQKGISEVQAEAKFKESLRDYYNKNYSRAILGFKDVISLNSNHDEARAHLEQAEVLLEKQIKELLTDTERSLANLQYGRAKAQSMRVLTLVAEQIPSYGRKIAEDSARALDQVSPTQDENLLSVPCDKYKMPDVCTRAQKLLKEARQLLGDEDALKEVR